jgi:hypothetical protein
MRKSLALIVLVVLVAVSSVAQEADLASYDSEAVRLQRVGMATLGGWAVTNLVSNSTLLLAAEDEEWAGFATMNLGWGGINLGLSVLGYLSRDTAPDEPASRLRRQRAWEHAYLFNAGVDVGYVFAGLWLREVARRTERGDRIRGFGSAIIVQGSALLVFDLVMFLLHRSNGEKLIDAVNRAGGG